MDLNNLMKSILKYLLEGLAVAAAAYYIPKKNVNLNEVAMIALTAAVTFCVLDMLAPSIGDGARHGAGFGIGAAQVGFPGAAVEGMYGGGYNQDEDEDVEGMCGGGGPALADKVDDAEEMKY